MKSLVKTWWPNALHLAIFLLLLAFDAPTAYIWGVTIFMVVWMVADLWLLRRRQKREREDLIEYFRRLERLQRRAE